MIFEKTTTDRLLEIARYIQWAGLGLISILLVASVLLIGNTIRLSLFARRREVEVMKLVGATNWFIRWPFVIEGVICGIVGAAASVVLLWVLKIAVVDNLFDSVDNSLTRTDMQTWLDGVRARFDWTVLLITHDIREAVRMSDRVVVLGPRPATVRREVPVDLPRPRTAAMVTTPPFAEVEERVLDALRGGGELSPSG